MFQRLTTHARDAVVAAEDRARHLRADQVGAGHLLLALVDTSGTARDVLDAAGVDRDRLTTAVREDRTVGTAEDADHLQELGIDLAEVRRRVEATFGSGALDEPPARRRGLLGRVAPSPHVRFGRDAKVALQNSLRAALDLGDRHVGSEHLLLALLTDPHVEDLLRAAGTPLDVSTARAAVLRVRPRSA